MIKRALTLVCVFLIFSVFSVYAGYNTGSIERVKNLGIMIGDEKGSFDADGIPTRAELASILIRLAGLEDVANSMEVIDSLLDVSEDHWAAKYIMLAYNIRIMVGDGNGKFSPEESVTYEQAVKALVNLLGYGNVAQYTKEVEWQSGYMSIASNIGLLRNVTYKAGTPFTRGHLAELIDNALDIDIMTEQVSDSLEKKYVIQRGKTLLSDLYIGGLNRGIVEMTYKAAESKKGVNIREDEVIISGENYKINGTNAEELLGLNVEFYISTDDGIKYLEVINPRTSMNSEIFIEGKKIISYASGVIEYEEDGDIKELRTKNLRVIYNGKFWSDYKENIFTKPNARFHFISNDGDDIYDVVKVTSSDIVAVLRLSNYDSILYLKGELQNGNDKIDFDASDIEYTIKDSEGTELNINALSEEDDLLEIFSTIDSTVVDIIKLTDRVNGVVKETDSTDGKITIDGNTYFVLKTKTGFMLDFSKIEIGKSYSFIVDMDNNIVAIDKKVPEETNLGYIYAKDIKSGLSGALEIKILKGTTTVLIEQNNKYYIQGKDQQEFKIYELAQKATIDGVSVKGSEMQMSRINVGDVVNFSIDADGKINRITKVSQMGIFGNRKMDAEVGVFGGLTSGAFGIDDSTVVFFIPAGDVDDDILAEMKFISGEYKCQGFKLDDKPYNKGNKHLADAVVFQTTIDSGGPIYFNDDVPFAVVQAKSQFINSDGAVSLRLTGYENGKAFDYITSSNASLQTYDILREVQCGDIVRFQKNFNGEIVNVEKINTGYNLDDPTHLSPNHVFYILEYGNKKQVFGVVIKAEYKSLQEFSTEYENILEISTNTDGSSPDSYFLTYKKSNAPYYYIYDYNKGVIEPAEFRDIVDAGSSSLTDASRVFLYLIDDAVRFVMIVR